jgi:predicted phage tail protein
MVARVDALQVVVNGNTAAISDVSSVVADIDGNLSATRTIRVGVDSNGHYYSAGMAIGVENSTTGMQSQVLFIADRFAIMEAINGSPQAVFVVEGGQVFMRQAIIKDGDIVNAKIGNIIQSNDYVAGTTGWAINKAGNFELNGYIAGQGRVNMTNAGVRVYDGAGTLRVKLGNLA